MAELRLRDEKQDNSAMPTENTSTNSKPVKIDLSGLREEVGLVGELAKATFDTWHDDKQQEAKTVCLEFCKVPSFLVLWSRTYGSGKSFASAAILNELLVRDIHRTEEVVPGVEIPLYYHDHGRVLVNGPAWKVAGAFVKTQDFFGSLKSKVNTPESREILTTVSALQRTPILVMDDFCRAEPTAFENDILYRIIDCRTNLRLPFVLTTNEGPSKLAEWLWGATASRLKLAKWEHLKEIDYRADLSAARRAGG